MFFQNSNVAGRVIDNASEVSNVAYGSIDHLVRAVIARLPFVAAGILVAVLFYFAARLVRYIFLAASKRTKLDDRLRILLALDDELGDRVRVVLVEVLLQLKPGDAGELCEGSLIERQPVVHHPVLTGQPAFSGAGWRVGVVRVCRQSDGEEQDSGERNDERSSKKPHRARC